MHITLLERAGCHLCDDVARILTSLSEHLDLQVSTVDIDEDDELVKEYGLRIPVILDGDGAVLAEGAITRTDLVRLLG